jgi:hypothetical protein
MKREQAVALVKEFVANQLILATWFSIDKKAKGGFEVHLRGDYNRSEIDLFLAKHNLAMKKSAEGYFIIYKP